MAKIHRCYNGTCLCQIVWILLDFADIADKQSFYKFLTDVGCDNTLTYSYFIVLIVQLLKTKFALVNKFQSPVTTQLSDVLTVIALTLLLSSIMERTVAQEGPTSVTIPTRPLPAITLLSI